MLTRLTSWLHDLPFTSAFVGSLVYRDLNEDSVPRRIRRLLAEDRSAGEYAPVRAEEAICR